MSYLIVNNIVHSVMPIKLVHGCYLPSCIIQKMKSNYFMSICTIVLHPGVQYLVHLTGLLCIKLLDNYFCHVLIYFAHLYRLQHYSILLSLGTFQDHTLDCIMLLYFVFLYTVIHWTIFNIWRPRNIAMTYSCLFACL